MPPSRLDAVYRSILLTKFFTKGWGNPENLRRIFKFRTVMSNRAPSYSLVPQDYPVEITKDEEWSDCHIIEGNFETPLDKYLPGVIPEETKTAYFQIILPKKWQSRKTKPVCLNLAGTGDHFKESESPSKLQAGELLLTSSNIRSLQDLQHYFTVLSRRPEETNAHLNVAHLESVIEQDFLEKMPSLPAR
ncbi:hypothetical protein QAD02_020707 [Eretmocerus hayati]|uniref:Uncharacterized protein n=1 Tax=Eretmocerus hayati TaxID=131215 RepID=A0ACC2PNM2_9HYME|nr:hypothetical protein QAD02_020707 [Eretmocerus hayati]